MISLRINPDQPVDSWRAQCIEHILPGDQVEVTVPRLGFTQLRQYFTVLNVVLLERGAQARLTATSEWLNPPLIPPYHREANITLPKPLLPR